MQSIEGFDCFISISYYVCLRLPGWVLIAYPFDQELKLVVRRQPGGTQLGLLPKQGYSWRSTNNTGEGSAQLSKLVGMYLESWAHSSGLETILN